MAAEKDGRDMSWADCVAALKAGATPSSFLPQPLATDTMDGVSIDVPATSHLYQRVGGAAPRTFQMVYLRPPFTLWDYVESGASSCLRQDAANVFDSELDVDLFDMFRVRFVDAPEFLGANWKVSNSSNVIPAMGGSTYENDPQDSLGSSAGGVADAEGDVWAVGAERVLDDVLALISSDADSQAAPFTAHPACNLSTYQWSVVFGLLAERSAVSVEDIARIAQAIGSAALGEWVLFGFLDCFLAANDEVDSQSSDVVALAQVAAQCCIAGGWTNSMLRERLDSDVIAGRRVRSVAVDLAISLAFSSLSEGGDSRAL
jgi:hypothetical protein